MRQDGVIRYLVSYAASAAVGDFRAAARVLGGSCAERELVAPALYLPSPHGCGCGADNSQSGPAPSLFLERAHILELMALVHGEGSSTRAPARLEVEHLGRIRGRASTLQPHRPERKGIAWSTSGRKKMPAHVQKARRNVCPKYLSQF